VIFNGRPLVAQVSLRGLMEAARAEALNHAEQYKRSGKALFTLGDSVR
jgi:hypothetical protein